MQVRIVVALAALAVAATAVARLSPAALAATPWGAPESTATTNAVTAPKTSSETTPATGYQTGNVTMTTTATSMFTATNPYSCTVQWGPQNMYTLAITNGWTAYLPERNTWVTLCGPGVACVSFGQMVAPTDPGVTQSYPLYPVNYPTLPHGLTTCTAAGATQVATHGPH
jgi:hypothetical protein